MKKLFLTLSCAALVYSAFALNANVKPLTLAWTASPTPGVFYNVYQVGSVSNTLVGTTVNLTLQVPAVDLTQTNTFGVTSTDGISESAMISVSYIGPSPAGAFHVKSSP